MQLVFAEEGCVLSIDADGEDADPDVIAETLLDALGAVDANEAERQIQGAIGGRAQIERR